MSCDARRASSNIQVVIIVSCQPGARIGHLALSVWTVDGIELWREKMILGESLARWELRNEFPRQGFVANPRMGGPVAGTGTLAPDLALRAKVQKFPE
jgi:hypothetical protein